MIIIRSLVWVSILTGCAESREKPIIGHVDYIPIENRNINPESNYSKDSIYLYFEQGFDRDTIEIQLKGFKLKNEISSTEVIDFAERFVVPKQREGKLYITTSKNHHLSIDLRKSITNKWAIYFVQDTLYAKPYRYAPVYE